MFLLTDDSPFVVMFESPVNKVVICFVWIYNSHVMYMGTTNIIIYITETVCEQNSAGSK
jgi:hypothetical protein